jgi:hypothetical protein
LPGANVALKLVAEYGNDMLRWPIVKHFTRGCASRLATKYQAAKILSSKTRSSSSKAAAALRLASTTVGRTDML